MHDPLGDQVLATLDLRQQLVRLRQEQPRIIVIQVAPAVVRLQLVQHTDRAAFRFHDLRHTYVVASIMAGDDVKTIQQNAGHYSSAFTLDRYAHVTTTMQRESANRMEKFIAGL